MSLYLKPGVKVAGMKPEILLAVLVAEGVYRELGYDLTVTSLLDGKHKAGSKHYDGQGVDLRTKNLDVRHQGLITARLRERLGVDYDVVLESDHLHLEHDPKTSPAKKA